MNKNLFPKGLNPTKNTHEVKKTPKRRKTDRTSPKTEEKGHQPDTKIHLINGSQSTHMIRTPSTCEETRDRISLKEPLYRRLGWITLTRCLYGSKNLGICEDATIGDGDPIDKS